MRIIGYGEDALTLAFLKDADAVEGLLREHLRIPDDVQHRSCQSYYRPSFGRGEGNLNGKRRQASFGEFDAIIQSPGHIVLIESKWTPSRSTPIWVHPHQCLRHAIFQEYLGTMFHLGLKEGPEFLPELLKAVSSRLESATGRGIPSERSALYSNLKWILPEIYRFHEGHSPEIHHVILSFLWKTSEKKGKSQGAIEAKLPEGVTLPCPKFLRVDHDGFKHRAYVAI